MPSVNSIVYNQTNLISWQTELPLYPAQIDENNRLIEEQNRTLEQFKPQLESTDSLIEITQRQLNALKFSANQDMMHHLHDGYHHHHHHGVMHYVGDIMRNASIANYETELTRLQKIRTQILIQMKPYEKVKKEAEGQLIKLRSRKKWLEQHISAASDFLQTLEMNPAQLVTTLTNKLTTAFTDYEDNHIFGLSPEVRASLIAVRYGLNILIASQTETNTVSQSQMARTNYLRLTGFLWDMYQRISQENKDPKFEKKLAGLVESTHILQDGDLPDNLQTNYSARAWFNVLKDQYPGYFNIKEFQLINIEQQIFNEGINAINKQIFPYPSKLQTHIATATKLIESEVQMKREKNDEVDYHFYGYTTQILNDILVNPFDNKAVKRLGTIAEQASGHSSVSKQVVGALLVVLGTLLIAASIAGFMATFGSISLLAAGAAYLGLTLFQAQIAFAGASTLAAASGVGLTFFGGPSLIKSGQRQGLSQELTDIKEEVMNHDSPPPYSASYTPTFN